MSIPNLRHQPMRSHCICTHASASKWRGQAPCLSHVLGQFQLITVSFASRLQLRMPWFSRSPYSIFCSFFLLWLVLTRYVHRIIRHTLGLYVADTRRIYIWRLLPLFPAGSSGRPISSRTVYPPYIYSIRRNGLGLSYGQ